MGVGAAIVGGSLISGIGSAVGGKAQADALTGAYDDASLALGAVLGEQKDLYSPWIDAGEKALQAVQEYEDFDFTNLDTFLDPSYEFRLQEGVDALDQSASARGNVMSGAQQQAVSDYGQNLASQEYGNAFNRALTQYNTNLGRQQYLTGVGQNAMGGYANALANYGSGMSGNAMQNGNNMANVYGGMTNALTGAVNSGVGNFLTAKEAKIL